MSLARTPSRLAAAAALILAACSSGDRAPANVGPPPFEGLRAADAEVSTGDALAANLIMVAGGTPLQHGGRASYLIADRALEQRAAFHAEAHLEHAVFAAGAGGGAAVDGSARIRRLAAGPDAPPDGNGNGSNLDETAARERAALAELVGAVAADGSYRAFMPWRIATAELAAVPPRSDRRAYGELGVLASPRVGLEVDTASLGAGMLARLHQAARLLQGSRGSRPGADADSGLFGLVLLEHVVALEETLLRQLSGRDGVLTGIDDPGRYDPRDPADALWVPARVQAVEEPGLPGVPAAFAVLDRASRLETQATLLEASCELAWMASDRDPLPTLRDLLRGQPFGEPPARRRPRGFDLAPFVEEVSFRRDVSPILARHCIGCHNSFGPQGGYSMGDGLTLIPEYELVIASSGNVGRRGNPPTVTSGDHARSLLWLVIAGQTTLVPRMPFGCGSRFLPCLSSGDQSLVADWIDQGLLREPTEPTPPPRPGEDLARVLLRNLQLLHADGAEPGALHDRYEGDAGSGRVAARSTGAALRALAVAAATLAGADRDGARDLLLVAARYAAAALVDDDGVVARERMLSPSAPAPATGDAVDHAAVAAGLFAAGRALGDAALVARARLVAERLLGSYWQPADGILRREPSSTSVWFEAGEVAVLLAALQEATDAGVAAAANAHDTLLARLLPALVASEWDGFGEVLDDGIADTDGNGIAEPRLAAGGAGRAPVFLREVRLGPDPDRSAEPVSWSDSILPLFRRTCVGCHVDGAAEGGFRLDTPALAATAGESGRNDLVVPGDAEASLLYRKLVDRRPPVGEQMPLRRPPLDPRGRELVRRWIAEGAVAR